MNPSVCLLSVLVVVGPALAAIIPPEVKGCKRDDPDVSECAVRSINAIKPALIGGDKALSIPVLDPFEIKNVVLSERNGQGLDLALNFDNLKVRGIKDAVVEPTSKVNLKDQTMDLHVSLSSLTIEAKYVVDGKILLLPIKGDGDANLTLGDLKVTFTSDFSLVKLEDGKEYSQLKNTKVDFTANHFNLYLDNMFNGDRILGDQMNVFLNENWQELLREFGPVLRQTIKTIIFSIVNNVALKVPFEVMFPK